MGSGTVEIGEISIKVNLGAIPKIQPHNPWASTSGGEIRVVASRGSTWAEFADAMKSDTAISRATFKLSVKHEFQQELEWCHFISVVLPRDPLSVSDPEQLKELVLDCLEEIDQPFRDNIRVQLGPGRFGLHARLDAEITKRIHAVEQADAGKPDPAAS